jgi:D-threo-aldose 1-dehydrogenase
MGELPRRGFGTRGLALTELGFGAASLGNLYRVTAEEEAQAAVDRAWYSGLRYFDTAPHYGLGLSERRLGDALRWRPRDEYVLSTKVGRLIEPNPSPTELDTDGFVVPGDLHRVWDFSADGVRRSLDASLRRLGVDRIDIAYVHDPDQFSTTAAREALSALVVLRDQGVLRAVGVGTNSTDQLAQLIGGGLVDVVMLAGRYTLLEQGALSTVLEPARRSGVAVVAVGVFNSGLLSQRRPGVDARYDYGAAPAEVVARAVRLAEVCEQHGVTLPEAAIAFPLRHPAVVNVTLGMRNAAQVNSNVARYEARVPEALWPALVEAGLVEPAAVA